MHLSLLDSEVVVFANPGRWEWVISLYVICQNEIAKTYYLFLPVPLDSEELRLQDRVVIIASPGKWIRVIESRISCPGNYVKIHGTV
jgi:hypothetical protein